MSSSSIYALSATSYFFTCPTIVSLGANRNSHFPGTGLPVEVKMCQHLAVLATCCRHVGNFLSQVHQQRQQHNHNEGNNAVMTTAKTHVHQQQQHHNCQLDNGKMTAHGWRLQMVQTFAVGECTTNKPLALPCLFPLFCNICFVGSTNSSCLCLCVIYFLLGLAF